MGGNLSPDHRHQNRQAAVACDERVNDNPETDTVRLSCSVQCGRAPAWFWSRSGMGTQVRCCQGRSKDDRVCFDASPRWAARRGRSLPQLVIVMAMVVAMALGEPGVRKHRRPTGLARMYN